MTFFKVIVEHTPFAKAKGVCSYHAKVFIKGID
jgi:hypothetical protein